MNRFIPKSAERQAPFFATLKGAAKFAWTEECSRAFEELKAFLTTPPVLAAPVSGDQLYLYVAIATAAVSSVLVKRDDKRSARCSTSIRHWWKRKGDTPPWRKKHTPS
ncbi:hypothetical protein LINPERPRIM_LOCUS2307 [Linum perenne]